MTGNRYERVWDGVPWGWWLRATPRGLEDEAGVIWPNVRTAFWEGHLHMSSAHYMGEQLEMMLRVLTAVAAHRQPTSDINGDIFGGDHMFWRFFMHWLDSVGMLKRGDPLHASLSDEGCAVMRMLQATRDPAWIDLPAPAFVEAVHRANRQEGDEAREAALRGFEGGVTHMLQVFARERLGRMYLVTLTSINPRDRMPTRRVVWSASFLDEQVRDDLFGWLAERVHRWEDWDGIARSGSARKLTAHLLGLLVASPVAWAVAHNPRDRAS